MTAPIKSEENPANRGSVIAVIPARYAATRFPAKLMQDLGGKTVLQTTYDAVTNTGLFDEVLVATDSEIIYESIKKNNGSAVMSRKKHESGSDRIAEAVAGKNVSIIINVQGDEPFMQKEPLEKLVGLFDDPDVQVASLMRVIKSEEEFVNPSAVKVVVNNKNEALYFSRAAIPYCAATTGHTNNYLHVGVYGFRKEALLQFTQWPQAELEKTEKLEQLRYLANGVPIKMALVDFENIAIDTPEDLEEAKKYLHNKKKL